MKGRDGDRAERWTDERMAELIGGALQKGVVVSAVVTLLGAAMLLWQHGTAPADYHVFRGEPAELRGVRSILTGALQRESRAIVQLGILLLIATPVVRVLLSLVAFVRQRDRLYTVVTTLVLAVLLFSLVLGARL